MKKPIILLSVVLILILSVVALNLSSRKVKLVGNKQVAETPTPAPQRIESLNLQAVSGYEGGGLATRYMLDGKFRHYVEVDLPDAPAGKFYEGWLVKNEAESELFSTGTLTKAGNKYVLNYESSDDRYDYGQVVITLETEAKGSDATPEIHVLEGSF